MHGSSSSTSLGHLHAREQSLSRHSTPISLHPANSIPSLAPLSSEYNGGDQQEVVKAELLRKGARSEVYGFVGWIATSVGFSLYLLWAFMPDSVFHSLGIYYYPAKHWAILIPTCFIFFKVSSDLMFYFQVLRHTAPLDSVNTFTDECARKQVLSIARESLHSKTSEDRIRPVEDINLAMVNKVLYLGQK
eukprot:GCRY01002980.1.p1 GENE.GCRY01002980.1~~GCRY01002980.1.p1  ORF type:complete len:190 (-),score=30.32 GCRY01002980.1:329-898(-)